MEDAGAWNAIYHSRRGPFALARILWPPHYPFHVVRPRGSMRLPSVGYIAGEARASFARFPLMLACALVAATCAIITVEVDGDDSRFVNLMITAHLGIALFFALATAAETNRWTRSTRISANAAAVIGLFAYHASLPDRFGAAAGRFLQLDLGVLLLCAFLPFLRGHHNGFWQYNRTLFLRFLTAVLYSAVIYLGLALALLAIDRLIGLSIPDHSYIWLLCVVAFVFNPWVFLGGVPRDIAMLESVTTYPRGLKVFAQYILIPLVVVYLAILTIYLFKVVITTVWPSGWIGWMVSSVAVVGIVALLLVWPVAGQREDRWVGTYTRWFFIFMIPAIVMLLLAIQRRIGQYGVTENRYFLAILSLWLAAIAVYFIASRQRLIKVIPVSLCILAFGTSCGPWGAYSVSRWSQTHRLEQLMQANHILVDGKIVATQDRVTAEHQREISSITRYLIEHHGAKPFRRWLDPVTFAVDDSTPGYDRETQRTRRIVGAMGLEYVGAYAARADGGSFEYFIDSKGLRVLDGAQYMVRLDHFDKGTNVGDTGLVVDWNKGTEVVVRDGDKVVATASPDPVVAIIRKNPAWTERAIPADAMRVVVENDRIRLVVYFTMLRGTVKDVSRTVEYVEAECYITPVAAVH
jgi:hypothetical protein